MFWKKNYISTTLKWCKSIENKRFSDVYVRTYLFLVQVLLKYFPVLFNQDGLGFFKLKI